MAFHMQLGWQSYPWVTSHRFIEFSATIFSTDDTRRFGTTDEPITWRSNCLMGWPIFELSIETATRSQTNVDVHILRTDKMGTKAALRVHKAEEYMEWADDYYDKLETEQMIDKRRVFSSSDNPKVIIFCILMLISYFNSLYIIEIFNYHQVIEEIRRKYPNYDMMQM